MLQKSSELLPASDWCRFVVTALRWQDAASAQRDVAEALVWPEVVVVVGAGLGNVIQSSEVEAEEVVGSAFFAAVGLAVLSQNHGWSDHSIGQALLPSSCPQISSRDGKKSCENRRLSRDAKSLKLHFF